MPAVLPTERIAHLGTADCCIRPPGRNETIAVTPPKIFSKEVAQNRPPHFPARTSSPPEIVSAQLSGDGAWMTFRFSRALPPGASRSRRDESRAGPLICLGRAGDACVVGALERVGNTLYGARVYGKLGRRLAHAHAARQSCSDSLSQLVRDRRPAKALTFTLGPL